MLKPLDSLLKIIGYRRESAEPIPPPDKVIQLFVEHLIGEPAGDISLFRQAFTHRSYPEKPKRFNNERLEFLGDSVLTCVVGALLYRMFEEDDEGALTGLRASLVSRSSLNELALHMGLDQVLKIAQGINLKQSDALGNSLEALIGAIYLDKGYDFTYDFISKHIVVSKRNLEKVSAREEDFKTEFIILMQQNKIPFEFRYLDAKSDPKLGLIHRSEIVIGEDERVLSTGVGTSKKVSHQNAAKDALKLIRKSPTILEHYRRKISTTALTSMS